MDKASAYGAGDCRFESCWGQFKHTSQTSHPIAFLILSNMQDMPNMRMSSNMHQ